MHPLLLGIFGGFIAGAAITADFERAAARELQATLGKGANVKIRTRASFGIVQGEFVAVRIEASGFSAKGLPLFTEPERSHAGKIDRLELNLHDFMLRGLTVSKLEATIPHCRYDRALALGKKRFRLSESGEGPGRVEVEGKELAAFALRKYKEVTELHFDLRDDRCTVDGVAQILFVKAPFHAEGRLRSPDGSKIELTDAMISFGGKAASPSASDGILKALNPVVDLDRDLALHGAMRIESISLRDQRLIVGGKARIPDLPEENQENARKVSDKRVLSLPIR
ncbi:hypothetical protein BH11ARM2_BH11ARM2_37250 [soil metagenome]